MLDKRTKNIHERALEKIKAVLDRRCLSISVLLRNDFQLPRGTDSCSQLWSNWTKEIKAQIQKTSCSFSSQSYILSIVYFLLISFISTQHTVILVLLNLDTFSIIILKKQRQLIKITTAFHLLHYLGGCSGKSFTYLL